jgi:hypothetical protein
MSRAKGGSALQKHLSGKSISIKQAVYGKCYECMGDYQDGKYDCEIPKCTLYPWMPYKGLIWDEKKELSELSELNKEEREQERTRERLIPDTNKKKRILSPEHLAKLAEGRRNRRNGVKKQ